MGGAEWGEVGCVCVLGGGGGGGGGAGVRLGLVICEKCSSRLRLR